MRNVVTLAVLASTFLGVPAMPADPPSDPVSSVADAYLASIQAQDWATMATFLDQASRYQDFTMEYFERDAIDLVGGEAIVEFWRRASASVGTSEIRYDEVKRFVAGPCVVLDFEIRVTVEAAGWGIAGGGDIVLEGTLITFLRIEDGKVTHHHDHTDYAAATRQVERLKADRGALQPSGG